MLNKFRCTHRWSSNCQIRFPADDQKAGQQPCVSYCVSTHNFDRACWSIIWLPWQWPPSFWDVWGHCSLEGITFNLLVYIVASFFLVGWTRSYCFLCDMQHASESATMKNKWSNPMSRETRDFLVWKEHGNVAAPSLHSPMRELVGNGFPNICN